jgi:hypothetical protein
LEETVTAYPWYETVRDASIEQGDLLRGFEVVIPRQSPDQATDAVEVALETYDVVIMTQTCDIEHGKVQSLLLCPWWDLWQFIETAKTRGQTQWGSEQREALRRGNLPGYHLINEASQDGIEIGLGIVDFHTVYTAPTNQVREFVAKTGPRLRLRPPYKEHLGQAFARFFMRVGLPIDIPKEKLKQKPSK